MQNLEYLKQSISDNNKINLHLEQTQSDISKKKLESK